MKLWSALKGWIAARLATPASRLGAAVGGLSVITGYVDQHGDPPVYLTGLLAATFGVWLGALGQQQQKEKQAIEDTANRAEAKADTAQAKAETADSKADALGRVAAAEHPEAAREETPPLAPNAGGA